MMLRRIRTALGFLTVLPASPREYRETDLGNAVMVFPLVGLVYALLTWGSLQLLGKWFAAPVAAWLTVFATGALNGWIHWDGFADMADGLGSRDKGKSLAIMKDSRLGAFGGIALCFLILGKTLLLAKPGGFGLAVCCAVFTLSRWGMAVLIYTQPSVSQGLLQVFQGTNRTAGLISSSLLTLAVLWFSGLLSLILLAATCIALIGAGLTARRRFGGITGDVLGAANELIELTCLFILNIKGVY